ncbi:oligosaccharide flippase family protein [Hydrogenimonas sp.]
MKFFSSSILNLGLRGLSMLAKFLLIIYIGKYLSVDELGEYGLFVTTITIAIYFLGLDFYTYNTREILSKPQEERFPLIRDQFIFHLIVYVVILPLLLSVFAIGIIETRYIVYFYLILIFEHLSQELYRLYTTLQKPIFANMLLFFRTGIWVYVVIILWFLSVPNTQNLETVWYGWSIGSFISIIIGVFYIKKEYGFETLAQKIDWLWIKNGVKVSIPFLIGTLAYKVIEFSDRYMIDYYMTKTDVGIYTFFGSIANTINIFIFTLVIMIYYPKLIEFYQKGRTREFKSIIKKFTYKTILLSIILSVGIVIFIHPIIDFMDKSLFYQDIAVLWLLIMANVILNISYIPHYILYAIRKDTILRNSMILGALLNVFLNIFLIKLYGVTGAAISTIASFLLILFIKYFNIPLKLRILKL